MVPWLLGNILSMSAISVLDRWAIVFYSGAAMTVISGATLILFGSAELQEWDKCPDDMKTLVEQEKSHARERESYRDIYTFN